MDDNNIYGNNQAGGAEPDNQQYNGGSDTSNKPYYGGNETSAQQQYGGNFTGNNQQYGESDTSAQQQYNGNFTGSQQYYSGNYNDNNPYYNGNNTTGSQYGAANTGYQQYSYNNNSYQTPYQAPLPADFEEPVKIGEWFVAQLLMMIPCINIIMMFVFAFGRNEKKSKSNFFKANLILIGVVYGFSIIIMILMVILEAAL